MKLSAKIQNQSQAHFVYSVLRIRPLETTEAYLKCITPPNKTGEFGTKTNLESHQTVPWSDYFCVAERELDGRADMDQSLGRLRLLKQIYGRTNNLRDAETQLFTCRWRSGKTSLSQTFLHPQNRFLPMTVDWAVLIIAIQNQIQTLRSAQADVASGPIAQHGTPSPRPLFYASWFFEFRHTLWSRYRWGSRNR